MNPPLTWSIDHIGLAVTNLDEAIATYAGLAHTSVTLRERLEKHGVEIAFLSAGGTKVELLSTLDSQNSLGRFLQNRGPGLHHIACPSIDAKPTDLTVSVTSIYAIQ